MKLSPARIASLLAGASVLLGSLAPAIANLDLTSTAGVVMGIVGIVTVLDRFLVGQRSHEARLAVAASATGTTYVASSSTTTGGFALPAVAPAPTFVLPEPGDAFDGLPHHPVTDPKIPVDHVDKSHEGRS